MLTARAENHVHGRYDLADTIARLQSFQEAGADVLFAPGRPRRSTRSASWWPRWTGPVNVLVLPGMPSVSELAEAGVSRISVGGGFAFAAYGAAVTAGRELLESGTYGFWETGAKGGKAAARRLRGAVATGGQGLEPR